MAYDSDTYGQSPFGNNPNRIKRPSKSDPKQTAANGAPSESTPLAGDSFDKNDHRELDDKELQALDEPKEKPTSTYRAVPAGSSYTGPRTVSPKVPPMVGKLAGKLGLGTSTGDGSVSGSSSGTSSSNSTAGASSRRKSRATSKQTTGRSAAKSATATATRKGKKTKAAQVETEATEGVIARRFQAEDRAAYLSLLYKTGISALVWAVLRLSRHELPDRSDRIINLLIHPLLVATFALLAVVGLTFWLRYLLNGIAQHTQQLHADAEETSGKTYRPTLEIVGDSLEYNPKLRKNLARLFDAASILVCTLVSYLLTSVLLP